MRILIAGGSGFLGRALTSALADASHQVTILTRRSVAPADHPARSAARDAHVRWVTWAPDGTLGPWARDCPEIDVVINLTGESIAAKRWSARRKVDLIVSRIKPTRSLVHFMEDATPRPSAFISSSAIGYYGDRGDETLTEDSRDGEGFLAELSYAWEQEALKASAGGTRVAVVRTGIVLDPQGGALAKLLPPFRWFAGGPFGTGRQYMSWIHRDDWVSLVRWLVETAGRSGRFNATAPNPVTNAEFAGTLGRVLRRPAIVSVPGFALRRALGEMAGPLLLESQRVLPDRALREGFSFAFPLLELALRDLLGARA